MKITIKTKKRKGHQSHRSGSGEHQDKRTKRARTRSGQKQRAIKEYLC
jgi:hypothetical protein